MSSCCHALYEDKLRHRANSLCLARQSVGAVVAAIAAMLGCGDPAAPYGIVQGKVTFQDRPVPNAVVLFESSEAQIGVLAEADENGYYQARRSADMPGLPPGEYHVAVTPPLFYPGLGPVGRDNAPPKRPDIPLRYRDVSTSGLTHVVEAQSDIPFDVRLVP